MSAGYSIYLWQGVGDPIAAYFGGELGLNIYVIWIAAIALTIALGLNVRAAGADQVAEAKGRLEPALLLFRRFFNFRRRSGRSLWLRCGGLLTRRLRRAGLLLRRAARRFLRRLRAAEAGVHARSGAELVCEPIGHVPHLEVVVREPALGRRYRIETIAPMRPTHGLPRLHVPPVDNVLSLRFCCCARSSWRRGLAG